MMAPFVGADPFNPKTTHQFWTSGPIFTSPSVCIVDGVAVACSMRSIGNSLIFARSLDYGASWADTDNTLAISAGGSSNIRLAGNRQAIMAAWIGGYVDTSGVGTIYFTVSTDKGLTWASPQAVSSAGTANISPVTITANDTGFAVAFFSQTDHNAYAMFTSDCGATWSSVSQITDSGDVASSVILCKTPHGFMATWTSSAGTPMSSVSTDNTRTWSEPVSIASVTNLANYTWAAANSTGCLAVWANTDGDAYGAFSSDFGATWSDPVGIGTGLTSVYGLYPAVSVAPATSGFIVGMVVGSDPSQAYIRFVTKDIILAPVALQVSTDGLFRTISFRANNFIFVALATEGDNCVYGWTGANGRANGSFTGVFGPPLTIQGSSQRNHLGTAYEVFSSLKWALSDSVTLAAYNIVRDGVQVGTVGPTTGSYEDHNQVEGVSPLYVLQLDDGNGNIEGFSYRMVDGVMQPSSG